jgi:plasmid stabilization system protein ParE
MSGRIVPERGTTACREIVVGQYRVLYRYELDEELVQILAVIHGARLLPMEIDLS